MRCESGSCGGDFAVYEYECEEDVVDVRFGICGTRGGWFPCGTCDAVRDDFVQLLDGGLDV